MSAPRDEPVSVQMARELHGNEFLALAERVGLDLSAMADPRTELSFAMARRRCNECNVKEKCRRVMCEARAPMGAVASFCPSADVLFDLASRQLRLVSGIDISGLGETAED